MNLSFQPGKNIAIKIPSHEYHNTVQFYRDVLGLKEIKDDADSTVRFEFGDKILWLDRMPGLSQSEIWLEIITSDIAEAARYLEAHDCYRRDDIEPLPEGFEAFWIANPSNTIHLVTTTRNL